MSMEETKPVVKDSKKELGDKLTKKATKQLGVSNDFKKPLVEKWKKYEELKAGKVKKKLRQQFNVALPVFSGMIDTLAADFDEPVELQFKKKNPADYFKAHKIQAAFDIERTSTNKDAKWDYKSRVDKSLNILHGRSILKYYAYSDPKYHSVLDVVDPLDFHCQPTGGGILENHLWCGQEGILRTKGDIERGVEAGIYDAKQWKELQSLSSNEDYAKQVTDQHAEKMQRFKALGLDPDKDNYIGEETYNLVEWCITHEGTRYYLLFDPWTMVWLRCEKLVDVFSKNLYPWTSWAAFEDNKVFWSQSYADLAFPVADAVITLFNQELTNREKQNLNARAYDKDMFPDVAKLDAAQYRPDALVPVDTKSGTRQIGNGIFTFTTPELKGTIDLISWINQDTGKNLGVTDISQGASLSAQKKVNVAYLEQASVAKRIGYKSQSYTECWGEIGTRYVQGLKDHMSSDMYIEVLGDMGIEPDVLTRKDLDLKGDLGVEVISSTSRKQESSKKKQARVEALKLLAQDQNLNSEWKTAAILRDIGDYDEAEIKLALDTKNYANRESVAKAHIAIQELLGKQEPEFNYAADPTFIKIIFDYSMEHRNKLGAERFVKFTTYVAKHIQAATQNGQARGAQRGQQTAMQQQQAQANNPKPAAKPMATAPMATV